MAIGFVPGAALLANLDRGGANLSLTSSSTTLTYFDVTNFRLGINTATPAHALDVTGNINVTGTIISAGNLLVNSGNLTTTATTVNVLNTTATTVNEYGDATLIVSGATTGTFNIRNANLYLPNATTIYSGQSTVEHSKLVIRH